MTIPAILFGILVSTFIGAAFHLWRGGNIGRLLLYILLAWAGFWGGHLLGSALSWTFLGVGPLAFGMALLGSFVVLGFGYWFSLVKKL
jgi:hypothetical protein